MQDSNIAVSVIICTYNRAEYIAAAIESALAQSVTGLELLILDDASTDNTPEIIRGFLDRETSRQNRLHDAPRIRYIRNEHNLGIAANRNKGLTEARGRYAAMLDSDDVWLDADKLAKQISFLETHQNGDERYALVGSWIRHMDKKGDIIGGKKFACDDTHIRQNILCKNQFAQSSVLFLRQAIIGVGGYDTSYAVDEDYDLWLLIGKKYQFANIPEFTTGYRVHDGSVIRQKRILAAQLHFSIIKKYQCDYPGYFYARIKALARIFLAYFF